MWCAHESLWQTVTTFCSWVSLHFISHKLASFQSMSRIRLILRRVILVIYVSSFVVCKGVSLRISDNVWADYVWIRFSFCLNCVVQCGCIKLNFLWIVSLMIFVSSFVVSVGICLTNNDDFSQLTVCAFRSTSVGSASVNVPASNWFAVDRVFQMTFVSSFFDVRRNLLDKQS